MPIYSPDGQTYRDRVHRNGREEDQTFAPDERLFRRYPKKHLYDGKPGPLSLMTFQADSGISVNRNKYSEPQDVLEPDCCEGAHKPGYVVLDIHSSDVPAEIPVTDGSGRVFQFRIVHKPGEWCFAHSEICCNEQGDAGLAHREPPKHVRNIFRGVLARHLATRQVLEFAPCGG